MISRVKSLLENKRIGYILGRIPYKQCKLEDIVVKMPERTLYIIGNGFDLMHGVPSSYYNFRDSLGKHSKLRRQLERWNLKEDLWADFETNLAYMDGDEMLRRIPKFMERLGVLDEDDDEFLAAEFFTAAEWSIYPLQIIQDELPRCFRKWINSLQPAYSKKPLLRLLQKEGRYINFNYTEFVETIYGIEKERIFYIHGDRREKKCELILGHAYGMEEDKEKCRGNHRPPYFNQTSYDLYETAARYVAEYYDATTKNSREIIRKNKSYFNQMREIKMIITIGHSLSRVDYAYFYEIRKRAKHAIWNFGWHGEADLKRIREFAIAMKLRKNQIVLFRV